MFSKFVIRNVGLLRAFDTPGSPKLSRLTLFYGRNGRGKSTLTSVLRAARDGCSNTICARRSLGNGGLAPEITLVADSGNIRFKDGKWEPRVAPIEVFDTTFITDNVYAGELTELAHDRGLFSIIIGKDGVKLASHLERFNEINKRTSAALKAAEAALADDKPTDIGLDEFFSLAPNAELDKRLEGAERAVKAVKQADKIAALKQLKELSVPAVPAEMSTILASTVAEIDASARDRLLEHFARFHLDKKAEEWVGYGLKHIHDDACPFCGREGVDEAGMVTLYGQIFGETYQNHLAAIKELGINVETAMGEDARTELTAKVDANAEEARKWSEYVRLEKPLPDMAGLGPLIADAHKAAKGLCEKKRASPLDKLEAAHELAEIAAKFAAAEGLIKEYNAAVVATNDATEKVSSAAPTTLEAAETNRDNLKKRKARHEVGVQNRVAAYFLAKKRDKRARDTRTYIQKRLKEVNEASAAKYNERVNHYLGRFGASFSISKITNSMQGNSGQVDYGLLIKGETVARGRGRQADAIPSFRNTLSAGDKTTLAFAFFLAMLDNDKDIAGKTIVIDDPLSSHDTHRTRETVSAIKDLCSRNRCKQVIVLSHDEFLLRNIQRRCVAVPSSAFQIDYSGADEWSVASIVDLDALCRADHAKMVSDIAAFVDTRSGEADDVVLKIRQVLETHYRRSFSAWFGPDQNLGSMIGSIRETGPSHPCYAVLGRLDNCDDATCDKHHGDHAELVLKRSVDPDELKVIALDALELIGARKPGGVLKPPAYDPTKRLPLDPAPNPT
ncbi:MAG: AAA family ATPase [Parvularcula sp.]|jgi:wobble nucleotide-excising tRNase|nr:AAA family ATPase [Parvularcula sp.]